MGVVTTLDGYSIRVGLARHRGTAPADIAKLAREAAADIDRGHPIEGCRRLVAIGALAKATADLLEAAQ